MSDALHAALSALPTFTAPPADDPQGSTYVRLADVHTLVDAFEGDVFLHASCPVMAWNPDKPHQCPACHATTDPDHLSRWRVVTCCRCGARFTRFPRLAGVLRSAGVVCTDHEGEQAAR